MTEPDDRALLERWRGGDGTAGQALFARHFESVFGFFSTKFPSDAEELTQKTFIACVEARDRFRGDSSFRTFLFAIAKHQLYNGIDSRRRADARFDYEVTSIAQLETTVGSRLARNQEHRLVLEALRSLPVEQQTLLELHYWQELDATALAEIFETTEVNIRQRLTRARKALRDVLTTQAPKHAALQTLESMDAFVSGFR